MAASEGPEKLRDLVDARAFRPDLSFCMGSIEATIFMDLSAESASGAVDKVKFLAKLDKHASKLGGGTSKSKATAARKKNAAMGGMVDDLAMLSLGGARSRSDGSSSGGDPRLRRLLQRMNRELPDALRDLERTGCKQGHWAWWAWPTEKEGFSEPHPPTAVTAATAPELLRSAPPVWREILEKVCELIDGNGGSLKKVIPSIDWGRIEHFVKFFEALPDADKPEWLKNRVLPCLKAAVAKSVNKTTMMSSMKFGGQRRTVNMSRF